MFDNNFGKCGLIFKIFHQMICKKILYVHTTKISTLSAICCYSPCESRKSKKCYQIFSL